MVTLTSLMQEVPMIEYPEENLELEDNMSETGGRFRRSCSVSSYTSSDYGSESDFGAAFEDEDTWYQWSTQYQQGPVDSVDTGMPSRMRKYSYMNGDDGSFDNEQTDRIFRRRMSRDRSSRERSRDIMELQREAAVDTSKKSPAVTRRAVKQLQLMVENLAGSGKKARALLEGRISLHLRFVCAFIFLSPGLYYLSSLADYALILYYINIVKHIEVNYCCISPQNVIYLKFVYYQYF